MSDANLLPCPFCGKPAMLDKSSDHHGGYFSLGCSNVCPGRYVYYMESIDCLESAVKRWDTRYIHRNGEVEVPTVMGPYWFSGKCNSYRQLEIAFMVEVTDGLIYIGDGPHKPESFDGKWWGPIGAPWEPQP